MSIKTVSCPACEAPVEWKASSIFRPFCSERCKLRDLGAWASESYRVPQVEVTAGTDDEQSAVPDD